MLILLHSEQFLIFTNEKYNIKTSNYILDEMAFLDYKSPDCPLSNEPRIPLSNYQNVKCLR